MMVKIAAGAAIIAGCLVGDAAAFSTPSHGVAPLALGRRAACSSSVSGLKMGLFDAIGKAMNDAMAPDPTLGKKENPGFREGYEGPRKAVATFVPGGQKVQTYAGERLGDVARKAGVAITYGCQKGTCGTCEVTLVNSSGKKEKVRTCEAIIPKQPGEGLMDFKIEMPSSSVTLKRQLAWEDVKKK